MTQEKTLWKKNLDSNFISGEDLIQALNGLAPEMVVILDKQQDTETFDQKQASKVKVTGLYFKDLQGKSIYKPVILNKTNARFFEKETGSAYMEDWYGQTVIMFAQKDSRHGHVVRFKRYVLPVLVVGSDKFRLCVDALKSGSFKMEQIKGKYQFNSEVEAKLMEAASNG